MDVASGRFVGPLDAPGGVALWTDALTVNRGVRRAVVCPRLGVVTLADELLTEVARRNPNRPTGEVRDLVARAVHELVERQAAPPRVGVTHQLRLGDHREREHLALADGPNPLCVLVCLGPNLLGGNPCLRPVHVRRNRGADAPQAVVPEREARDRADVLLVLADAGPVGQRERGFEDGGGVLPLVVRQREGGADTGPHQVGGHHHGRALLNRAGRVALRLRHEAALKFNGPLHVADEVHGADPVVATRPVAAAVLVLVVNLVPAEVQRHQELSLRREVGRVRRPHEVREAVAPHDRRPAILVLDNERRVPLTLLVAVVAAVRRNALRPLGKRATLSRSRDDRAIDVAEAGQECPPR